MNTGSGELYRRFGVTGEQLDEWADEYEGEDWSHMRFGDADEMCPQNPDEQLVTITVRIPRSQVVAVNRILKEKGLTMSEFVLDCIDDMLISLS